LLLLTAALGFGTVALAAAVGVLRFGFSAKFAEVNASLAKLAAFVGLPMVGLAFAVQGGLLPQPSAVDVICYILFYAVTGAVARGLPQRASEPAQVLFNSICFILPVGWFAVTRHDGAVAIGLAVLLAGSVVIGPHRHRFLLGLRHEDWFHYCLAVANVMLARQLIAAAAHPETPPAG